MKQIGTSEAYVIKDDASSDPSTSSSQMVLCDKSYLHF